MGQSPQSCSCQHGRVQRLIVNGRHHARGPRLLLVEQAHYREPDPGVPQEQQYDPTSIINKVRGHVDSWRALPNPNQWQVTPGTAQLLQHWRQRAVWREARSG